MPRRLPPSIPNKGITGKAVTFSEQKDHRTEPLSKCFSGDSNAQWSPQIQQKHLKAENQTWSFFFTNLNSNPQRFVSLKTNLGKVPVFMRLFATATIFSYEAAHDGSHALYWMNCISGYP